MKVLLVVYDNDSYIHWFPQGLAYIAAVLKKEGYDVEIYNQDFHHYSDEHLNADLFAANFTTMAEEELYLELKKANVRLLENYFENKKNLMISQTNKLYSSRDASFRGFRQS